MSGPTLQAFTSPGASCSCALHFESSPKEIAAPVPQALEIEGVDDEVTIVPSDRFLITYSSYLDSGLPMQSQVAEELMKSFRVTYSEGRLKSALPSAWWRTWGGGIKYHIGLPPGMPVNIRLIDGNVRISAAVLGGLRVYGADGSVEMKGGRIEGLTEVAMGDGAVTIDGTNLKGGGQLSVVDGTILMYLSRENVGQIVTHQEGDGNIQLLHGGLCQSTNSGISCGARVPDLSVSVKDGKAELSVR